MTRSYAAAPARMMAAALVVLPPIWAAAEPPAGAASCSGCHPAGQNVDTSVPRLAGREPAEIVAAMESFRSGQRQATVMGRIAKGFTPDETAAIAAWYGGQKD